LIKILSSLLNGAIFTGSVTRNFQNSPYFRCPVWKTKSWKVSNVHENWSMQTLFWSILN